MLICENLQVVQGDFRMTADLAFDAGKTTALIGPSGAGKSTLLAALAGFVVPVAGRVMWAGQDLGPLAPGARPISAVFQDNNLFAHLSVAENVGLGLRPALRLIASERALVQQALSSVGLRDFADRKPGQLSGGQQSRVALARVLLAQRPIVVLDEPFAALGPALKDEMLDLVQDMLASAGRTVLIVTHDPQDAHRIADQVAFVGHGSVTAPVDTSAFFSCPTGQVADYLGETKKARH